MAKRVSIINFKGGVGKTTLAFHLGAGLVRYHGARVLLVDMDHQSSLSILCLLPDEWRRAVKEKRTVDSIFRSYLLKSGKFPGIEIIVERALDGYAYRDLELVPASLELDDTEIALTAARRSHGLRSEWDKRTLLCRWLEEANIDEMYDYVIFDCPPATKIVSQNAIAASHGYIVPVVPEAVMERGVPHLREMVRSRIDAHLSDLAPHGSSRKAFVRRTKLIGIAVTRIQTSRGYSGYTDDHTQHLRSLQRRWKDVLVEPFIVQGTGLSQALADGCPVYDRSYTQNVGERGIHTMYKDLTSNLKARIDAI